MLPRLGVGSRRAEQPHDPSPTPRTARLALTLQPGAHGAQPHEVPLFLGGHAVPDVWWRQWQCLHHSPACARSTCRSVKWASSRPVMEEQQVRRSRNEVCLSGQSVSWVAKSLPILSSGGDRRRPTKGAPPCGMHGADELPGHVPREPIRKVLVPAGQEASWWRKRDSNPYPVIWRWRQVAAVG